MLGLLLILGPNTNHRGAAALELTQEGGGMRSPQAHQEQLVHFGDHEVRGHRAPVLIGEPCPNVPRRHVVVIVGVDQGEEGGGVDEDTAVGEATAIYAHERSGRGASPR